MPVGAGSIRRVAKAAGTEMTKEVAAPVVKGAAEKKVAEKKTATRTTTASNTKATNISEYNKVYHITEELPIYLL